MARTSKRAKKSESTKNTPVQPAFGSQPATRAFTIEELPGLYGLHVPYDVGYDAATQKNAVAGAGIHIDDWNMRLIDQKGVAIDLWIHEFDTSFQMGGSTGQSRYHRQFFPRNFTQPVTTVSGRVANTYEYNRLSAFVRRSHYYALRADEYAADQKQTTGSIQNRHLDSGAAIPTVTMIFRGGGLPAAYNAKGVHKPWVVEGYIKSMPAGARHHDPAPEFKFDFIISQSHFSATTGIYEDNLVVGSQLLTWMDVFEKNKFASGSSQPNKVPKPGKPFSQAETTRTFTASGSADTGDGIWDILTNGLF